MSRTFTVVSTVVGEDSEPKTFKAAGYVSAVKLWAEDFGYSKFRKFAEDNGYQYNELALVIWTVQVWRGLPEDRPGDEDVMPFVLHPFADPYGWSVTECA